MTLRAAAAPVARPPMPLPPMPLAAADADVAVAVLLAFTPGLLDT